ncbi:Protein transport protein S9 plasma membrane t-SNARE [Mortierella hygrophila]|uniref:Protein transport protein S9 plasma membrane t-SNARE n=1 Tax=Mortierella hygrophila TaxID=979708 RepID=A0A9P6FAL3_9FUNG|nr:Protein transport protein S9 plasma membrane t-SNARE [Mortierella hygrophila]
MASYGGNNNGGSYGGNSYGANRPAYGGNNSYGGNSSNGSSYGGNSAYGSQSSQSSYGQNSNGGGGYNSAPRPGQYGQQQQQYGQNSNSGGYGGNQYGSNNQGYGGNQYGSNQQGGNQYGGQQYNNYGGYGDRNQVQPGQETEEDVDRVSQQIRDTRQESVNSTRNALRALQEAEESSGRTMGQLGEQSEQLGRIERSLDSAQIHADNAQEKAGELKTVNRSMFAIHIKNPFNSTKKREKELEEAKRKAAEEMAQREAIHREEYQTKQRIDMAMGNSAYGRAPGNTNNYSNDGRGGPGERSAYAFENTAEDDSQEAEIDQNLDAMGGYLARLKTSAMTMNQEVNRQNERMTHITSKTDNLHGSVTHNTALLNKIAKRG